MKRKALYFLILLAAAVAVWTWWEVEEREVAEHQEETAVEEGQIPLSAEQIDHLGIQIQAADAGELKLNLVARGRVTMQPDNLVHILPKISGVTQAAHKNIGDYVQPGDLLAVLMSREMAQIKADYLAAVEKERLQLSLYDRERRLFQKQISSEQDYLNAQTAYEEARIHAQSAEQKLQAFGLDREGIFDLAAERSPCLCLYEIRSPIEGRVIKRDISNGEFIESASPIYTVADLSRVWVEIGIYPKDLFKVREGQLVEVTLPGANQTQKAKLIYLSPIIEEETITAKAIAELDNSEGEWRPGTFVQVVISTDQVQAPILVPKEAIQTMDGHEVVFTKTETGFQKKPIKIGRSDESHCEVLEGLDAGEPYAVSKTFYLKAALIKGTED